MSTEHIARNRRAKAVALATVLHDCTTITCHSDVYDLTPAAWELAAQAATARKLLGVGANGKPNRVHVPHSIETVAAVERELRMLQVEARVEPEQPTRDAGRPGMRAVKGPNGRIERFEWTDERRATDSAGYREHLARIAPLPEDPFAAYAQADQPHAIR